MMQVKMSPSMIGRIGEEHLSDDGSVLLHLPEAAVVLALHLGLARVHAAPQAHAAAALPRRGRRGRLRRRRRRRLARGLASPPDDSHEFCARE